MPRTMRRPIGIPTSIDDIVSYTDEGVPVTAGQRIIQILETGDTLHSAAHAAHIQVSTIQDWVENGAAAANKRSKGVRLTANERRWLAFSTEVGAAQARARERYLRTIYEDGTQGTTRRSTSTKTDASGAVVETVERVEQIPPNPVTAQWMLERRWWRDFGRHQQLEVTGPDGGPMQVTSPLSEIMAALDAMDRRGRAIETMGREVEPGEGDDGPDGGASVDET
jgi:hypothetical protein